MRKVCVWIDHNKAVVAAIDEGNESLETIASKAGRHARATGGDKTATPWGPQAPNEEHARERRYEHHLVEFYREVIRSLGRPDQLLVMGPAQAKQELQAEIGKSPLRQVPIVVETADEMSDARVMERLLAFEIK
jgi:hypothetical protein